ncbi:hypothetical protein J4476_03585 [Candidatus Woesearchaeota archaeon]|nr:MAG: hypothetical protein QT09_C0006G0078 [archaeon GW2011_AR18]MBS3161750.1 hypothetical protein [Candidatus Woesearchaeota archaeon]HIH26294.1 hypothetical protein [Nanoarchaeota archaeon]
MEKIEDKFLVRSDELSDFIERNNISMDNSLSVFIVAVMYFQEKGVVNGERYLWVYQSGDRSELVLANVNGKLARHMGEAMGYVGHRTDNLDPQDERLRFHNYERIQVKNERDEPLTTYEEIYASNDTIGKRTSLAK